MDTLDRRTFLRKAVIGSVALAAVGCGGGSHATSSGNGPKSGSGAKTGTIKIGGVFSQTGTYSVYDVPASLGLQMAVEDINKSGGVMVGGTRYTFDLKLSDIASNAANAAAATQTLITQFGSKIIFGPCYSVEAEPVVEAVQRAGDVVMLSVATKMDSYVGKGTPLFRLSSPDSALAQTYVKVVHDKFPNLKNLAEVFIDDAITQQLFQVWTPVFSQYGIRISQKELFPADDTNLVPVLQRVSKHVDGLFIGYTDPAATEIINAAAEVGLPPVFLARGPGGVPGQQAGGKAALYVWGILVDDPLHPTTPETTAFYQRYSRRFGKPLDANSSFALNYYPYIGFLAQAIKAAGSASDASGIADGLRGHNYTNVMQVGFDAKGINNSPVGVGIFDHGKRSVVKP